MIDVVQNEKKNIFITCQKMNKCEKMKLKYFLKLLGRESKHFHNMKQN